MLCDTRHCKEARVVMTEMPTCPDQLYDKMLTRIGAVLLNSTHDEELFNALCFLGQFSDSALCPTLCDHDTLRRAVWVFMDTRFAQVDIALQAFAFYAASNLVVPAHGVNEDQLWACVMDRALPILVKAVLHVHNSTGPSLVPNETLCGYLSKIFQTVADLRPNRRTGTDESVYKLSRNDSFRVMVMIYDKLNTAETVDAANAAAQLCYRCSVYLFTFYPGEALRLYFLYKPPRQADAKPMVVLMKEAALRSNVPMLEHIIGTLLAPCIGAMAGLAEAVSTFSKPAPPARSAKDRHCASPGCVVTSQGLLCEMKKCGRCKSVYYCSAYHQKLHWPEHRSGCVKQAT